MNWIDNLSKEDRGL